MFWGFLVLWRRPRQRSKDRVAHLNWNSPWHPPSPSLTSPHPLPTIFKRSETSWHTGRFLAKFWVVGKISRSCCKGVDCAGFENLLCASKTAKFGGWLKMYITIGKYPNKVECDSSLSKVYLTFYDWPSMWLSKVKCDTFHLQWWAVMNEIKIIK